MTPEKKPNPDDPKRNPFDDFFRGFGINPDDFDKVFRQMEKAMQDAMRNMGGIEPGKNYMHGFTMRVGPDGKPTISEFGNRPQSSKGGARPVLSDEREPATDVIEETNQVTATLELPGVEKKDIDVRVTEKEIEINVDNDKRKYHKLIALPAAVVPTTTKASYKNGVLDVAVQKVKGAPAKKGHRVSVD